MAFTQSKSIPCVLYLEERGLRAYVYGGNFIVTGIPASLKWMRDRVEDKYAQIAEVLGPDEGQQGEVRILSRTLHRNDSRVWSTERTPDMPKL